eukprot:COSAG02_NODE_793_length_17156_cov_54.511051_5_plen_99_part_00
MSVPGKYRLSSRVNVSIQQMVQLTEQHAIRSSQRRPCERSVHVDRLEQRHMVRDVPVPHPRQDLQLLAAKSTLGVDPLSLPCDRLHIVGIVLLAEGRW